MWAWGCPAVHFDQNLRPPRTEVALVRSNADMERVVFDRASTLNAQELSLFEIEGNTVIHIERAPTALTQVDAQRQRSGWGLQGARNDQIARTSLRRQCDSQSQS